LNTKTRGLGELTVQSAANEEDNKRYKALTGPIRPEECFSGKYATPAAAASFFKPKATQAKAMITTKDTNDPLDFGKMVGELVNNEEFQMKHKDKSTPLAMLAFVDVVAEKIINKGLFHEHFNGIEMAVPTCKNYGGVKSTVLPLYCRHQVALRRLGTNPRNTVDVSRRV